MVATFLMPAVFEQVVRRKAALDDVGGAGPEERRVGPLRVGRIRAHGQGRVRVGRRDLHDVGRGEHRLQRLRDRGVERTDDADDLVLTGQLGGGVLADVGLGLVVLGRQLQGPAGDGLGLVGLSDGQVDRVSDAQTQSRQVPRQRCDDADLGDLGGASPVVPPSSARLPQADMDRVPRAGWPRRL